MSHLPAPPVEKYDRWSTASPILAGILAYVGANRNPMARRILELGAGWYSTPLLHACAAAIGYELFTVESDASWLHKFERLAQNTHHYLLHVKDFNDYTPLDTTQFDVVFIDHAPASRRKFELQRVLVLPVELQPRFVVIHDTEPHHERSYGLAETIARFAFRREFAFQFPYTTVVSMTTAIPAISV